MKYFDKCLCALIVITVAVVSLIWIATFRLHLEDFFPRTTQLRKAKGQVQQTPIYSVTRIIHQSWKNHDVPERFRNYSKSWMNEYFKQWKYMFWTDDDNRNLIKYHYPWFLKAYDDLPGSIERADVSRYFYLLHYGGVYTDLDNECLKPFEHLLHNFSLVFGAMKGQYGGTHLGEGYVQNSFMYSIPRHEFWIELILAIKDLLYGKRPGVPEALTGPIVLSNTIGNFRQRHVNMSRYEIKVYEPRYFNPFSWLDRRDSSPHCKDFNRMTYDDWQICKSSMIKGGSFVIQYHAHSWG